MRYHSVKTEPRPTSTFRTQAGRCFLTDAIYFLDSGIGLQRHLSDPLREGSNICMAFIARSVILLLMMLGTLDSFAQNARATDIADVPVSFTLEAPCPSCGVARLEDVNFGILGKPTLGISHGNGINGAGQAWLDEQMVFGDDYLTTLYGVTSIGGNPTVGKLKITAGNANTLTITWDFPEYLIMGDSKSSDPTIEYHSGHYAHSRSEDGPWERMHWQSVHTLPYEGEEAAGTHYFQIGGTIYLYHDTEPGHYDNTMTVSVACL